MSTVPDEAWFEAWRAQAKTQNVTTPAMRTWGAWGLGLTWNAETSVVISLGKPVWQMSAKLLNPKLSTVSDWKQLGAIIGAVGAPKDCFLTPPEITPPEAVHHLMWHVDGTPVAAVHMAEFRELYTMIKG